MELGLYGGAKIKFQKRKKANCVDIEDVSLKKNLKKLGKVSFFQHLENLNNLSRSL